ncbi:hypothetical protein RRG08_029789 [Elysia crispata]|uniref:Uncharacterized protein n=1 Tax=Elysia crispata TaxID=231223 RepID=A0AAE1D138_9GAST|nr:hypothetical protein RRG08_029789 [Elysia crispata]
MRCASSQDPRPKDDFITERRFSVKSTTPLLHPVDKSIIAKPGAWHQNLFSPEATVLVEVASHSGESPTAHTAVSLTQRLTYPLEIIRQCLFNSCKHPNGLELSSLYLINFTDPRHRKVVCGNDIAESG